MEDNLNAIIVGIAEDIFILLHGMLLVATKEIYLMPLMPMLFIQAISFLRATMLSMMPRGP